MDAEGTEERRLLADVREAGTELVDALLASDASEKVVLAGSARRWTDTCKDIDIVATASDPTALATELSEHPLIAESGNPSGNGLRARTHNGIALDLRIVPPDEFGNLLQHFTGSKEHNVKLRERAVKMGLSVSEHGIADVESGEVTTSEDESGVYERLGLAYIEPELRQGRDEIAARRGRRAARAGHARGPAGRPPLPHHPLGRQEHARRDGRGGEEPRLRLPRDHRPLRDPRLRRRRPARPAATPDRGGRGVQRGPRPGAQALPAARRLRGQHPPRRLARLRGRAARPARLGGRQRPYLVPDQRRRDDRTRRRRRSATRSSTASATPPGGCC